MRFRITARMPAPTGSPVAASPSPEPSVRAEAEAARAVREAVCRTCPELAGDLRCVRPCGLCPADERRVKPWERMPRCPAGRWR